MFVDAGIQNTLGAHGQRDGQLSRYCDRTTLRQFQHTAAAIDTLARTELSAPSLPLVLPAKMLVPPNRYQYR